MAEASGSRSARSMPQAGDAFEKAFKSPRGKMTTTSPRDRENLRKSSSGNGSKSARRSRSKNGGKHRDTLSSSLSSSSIAQVKTVVWPGHVRPHFDPGTNDVSVDSLHTWSAIVRKAKAMGQSDCVVCGLVDGKDYEWKGRAVFLPDSPFDRLDAWREMHYVTFSIMVPTDRKNESKPGYPEYPRDYYRSGVLIADWFVPHPKMIKEMLMPRAYTEEYLTSQLPVFDEIVARAKKAGQMECSVMMVQQTSGYEYKAEIYSSNGKSVGAQYTYTLTPVFECVMEWACRHGYVIDVRVPKKPMVALGGVSLHQAPCTYGWIVVTWALVLE